MGKSIFKGWIADNDPRYSNNTVSVCVGTSFSLAGRPAIVDARAADLTVAGQSEQETGSEERSAELTTAQTGDSTIPDASIQAKLME